jgi:hypothetical protein
VETCEIRLEATRNLGLVQRWRFVATDEFGEEINASEPFWSLSGLVFGTGREHARVRDLLHELAKDGWAAWSGDVDATRRRAWWAHRLYRAH